MHIVEERRLTDEWTGLTPEEKVVHETKVAASNSIKEVAIACTSYDELMSYRNSLPLNAWERTKEIFIMRVVEEINGDPAWATGLSTISPSSALAPEHVIALVPYPVVEAGVDMDFAYDQREVPNPPPVPARFGCHRKHFKICPAGQSFQLCINSVHNLSTRMKANKVGRASFPIFVKIWAPPALDETIA